MLCLLVSVEALDTRLSLLGTFQKHKSALHIRVANPRYNLHQLNDINTYPLSSTVSDWVAGSTTCRQVRDAEEI